MPMPCRSLAKEAGLKAKVAELEEAERLRRLRAQAMGVHAQQPGSRAPDMSTLLQQVQQGEAGAGGASAGQGQGSSGGVKGKSSEPKGRGEQFQPGTWRPGS